MPTNLITQIIGFILVLIALIGGGAGLTGGASGPSGASSADTPHLAVTPSSVSASPHHAVTQQELIDATNRYRAQHGLPAVRPMSELNTIAQDWANTMASEDRMYHNPHYFEQYPAGKRSGAENVIMSNPASSADRMVQRWHNSPGHRKNMQNPNFTHIGVGIAVNSKGSQYAVQNFASIGSV